MKNHDHLIISKKKHARPDGSAHIRGVHQGNDGPALGRADVDAQHKEQRRSTGVASDEHGPIDPKMPYLPPA
jgi:hypothetical protein